MAFELIPTVADSHPEKKVAKAAFYGQIGSGQIGRLMVFCAYRRFKAFEPYSHQKPASDICFSCAFGAPQLGMPGSIAVPSS